MRIMRLKLKGETKELLAQIASQFGLDDAGFAEDLYALVRLKGHGIPSLKRVEQMAAWAAQEFNMKQAIVSLLMKKRRQVLGQIAGQPYFYALLAVSTPVEATGRIIAQFKKFYLRYREAQCLSCHLSASCDFGKQYGSVVKNIARVVDPDFQRKVHPDCPNLPEIATVNMISAAIVQLGNIASQANSPASNLMKATNVATPNAMIGPSIKQMAQYQAAVLQSDDTQEDTQEHDPDEEVDFLPNYRYGSFAKGDLFRSRFNGQHACQVIEDFVEKVTHTQLMIYELGRELDVALDSGTDRKFNPVDHVDKDRNPEYIRGIHELPKVAPSQHALPDEVFDAKLAHKSLVKNQHRQPDKKKQLLYVLLDSSGSMSTWLGGNQNSLLTRGTLASVLTMALARKIKREGGILFVRFFEGSPGPLIAAREADQFDALSTQISLGNYNGYSTDILSAIRVAVSDIEQASDELAKAEILVVTDCDDSFDVATLTTALKGFPLNALDVSGGGHQSQFAAQSSLKSCAKKFYKADEAVLDLKKLVSLV